MIGFIGEFWHAVHKKNVTVRVRIGFGDPADTGQLWLIFGPAEGLLANAQEASVEFESEFFDTTFELDCSRSIRLIALQVMTIMPIAVIICVSDGITVFDLDAKAADFEALKRNIPELNSLAASFCRTGM